MASITIRNLAPEVKAGLRVRAARKGRSMEEEARAILRDAVASDAEPAENLADAVSRLFRPFGGVKVTPPPREPMREPPKPR